MTVERKIPKQPRLHQLQAQLSLALLFFKLVSRLGTERYPAQYSDSHPPSDGPLSLYSFNIHVIFTFLSHPECLIFSSPGRSPGRTIVLPPASALASALVLASALAAASALAKSLTLKFFM